MIQAQPAPDTRLHGRWLRVARLVFIVITSLMLGVGLMSYLAYARVVGQVCATTEECQSRLRFTPDEVADFERQGVPLEFVVALRFGSLVSLAVVSCAMGLAVAVLRSDDWMALFVALFLIGFGAVFNSGPTTALIRAAPFVSPLVAWLAALTTVQFPLFFAFFPNGRIAPHWMRWLTPLWCLLLLSATFIPNIAGLLPPFNYGLAALSLTMIASLMGAQVIRYRRYSTQFERQQTKWVVLGVVAFLGIFILTGLLALLVETTRSLGNSILLQIIATLGFNLSPIILPICVGIAVVRSRLFDIDLIIRRTLQYSLLSGLLALVYFGSVVVLQRIFTALTGQGQNQLVAVVSTLAIAALFAPLRRRVQDWIDRRFYRKKYDAAKVIAEFGATCRDETDLDKLTARLVEVVQETMQPERVSLWLRKK